MQINYKDVEDKSVLKDSLYKLLNKKVKYIEIINIPSSEFCEIFNCEAEDFNGWQCDWWSTFDYKNTLIQVTGCAWYGTVSLSIK